MVRLRDLPEGPHLFALPPGVDFARAVVTGLLARLPDDPLALAQVEIWVNTRRTQRQIQQVCAERPRLLPRLRLITDPGNDPTLSDLPPATPTLRRRLELTRLVDGLLSQEPDLAAGQATYALADSLGALLSEMAGEGVPAEALDSLDVTDQSGHWARALNFLRIASEFTASAAPDSETRQRAAVDAMVHRWRTDPPTHPIIIAGSTGSRGTTAVLMRAVAQLPQGVVILPGVDLEAPASAWDAIGAPLSTQDHPQYRFAVLARALGLDPAALPRWTTTQPPSPARNALVSLALRPAPVTDQWRVEGPKLADLAAATKGLTLIEAPSPRIEAEAIALRLAHAARAGRSAALVTPDRVLSRQVSAALSRYDITADDSAGEPLHLSAPGRLLRMVAQAQTGPMGAEALLSLLKHPLAHSHDGRMDHLNQCRAFELHLRRNGPPIPDAQSLTDFAKNRPESAQWALFVTEILNRHLPGKAPLPDRVAALITTSETLCGGPGRLWQGEAGRLAQTVIDTLRQHAAAGADMTAGDFAALVTSLLQREEVRRPVLGHPLIKIWGTLEARVQSTDLVILAALNEGTWPEAPAPDPWLNRVMRAQAGLLLPDRQIGLRAHDFQQAIGAAEVVLSRAKRSDEAETVPSRWLNRLTNLLEGLEAGAPCLAHMRARGAEWIAGAERLDRPATPMPAAPRPAPRVPLALRPRSLRVTDLSQLHRDPYRIYAREVLRLPELDPLEMSPDARIRGIAIHQVMEEFVRRDIDPTDADAFRALAREILTESCHWPTARIVWLAQLDANLDTLLRAEAKRAKHAAQRHVEIPGKIEIPGTRITLRGRADRIDLLTDGQAQVFDYKTGKPPSRAQQLALDKQLLVEAAMIEHGAFAGIGMPVVAGATYLQIGSTLDEVAAPLDTVSTVQVWDDLKTLLSRWSDPGQGYTARMAAQSDLFRSGYDQLSRFGEWDLSDRPNPEDMG